MITVRYAREEDLDRVTRIGEICSSEPWTRDQLAGELAQSFAHLLVAEEDGTVLGFADLHVVCDDAHLNEIGVVPEARRRGAASALMDEMLRVCRQAKCAIMSLEVRDGNAPAIALYERYGFTQAGIRRRFYRGPVEDARTMILNFEV